MNSTEMYVQFMFTLAVGLAGVGMVLKTLLDTILREWDAVYEIRKRWQSLFHARPYAESVRAEDILMEIERDHVKRRMPERLIDRRREALRGVREAEDRLSSPRVPESV
ncbi:MAG: hypothetical protein HY403_11550 [Elusimicrobia bacterium]|nr:hypothetical protein [Elusimicrobiota bacterium]